MELIDSEKMLLEMLQEKDAEAQRLSQQRIQRFLSGISERVGIPAEALGINPQTRVITDNRITTTQHEVVEDEPREETDE